jgi:hypothetical protein
MGKDIGPLPNYSEMSGRVIVNNLLNESQKGTCQHFGRNRQYGH